jgi:hypothetical protein
MKEMGVMRMRKEVKGKKARMIFSLVLANGHRESIKKPHQEAERRRRCLRFCILLKII